MCSLHFPGPYHIPLHLVSEHLMDSLRTHFTSWTGSLHAVCTAIFYSNLLAFRVIYDLVDIYMPLDFGILGVS